MRSGHGAEEVVQVDVPRWRSGRPAVRRLLRVALARFRRGGRAGLAWTLRLTAAAVASYAVGVALFPHTLPLTAPLTALLVVQLTPVSLLASGFDRVFSVVAGVSLAVLVSTAVNLTWWSLGLVIAVSLVIGQVLRLGSNLLEVPISAMLVLGVGSLGAESAAGQRIAETLVGAGVGVLSNLLVPPKVATVDAGVALQHLAQDLAELLESAADDLSATDEAGAVPFTDRGGERLDRARSVTHDLPGVGSALIRAEQGRRLNLRALGTPDAGPGLRQGMEALEHCAVTVRGLFRSLRDAGDGDWASGPRGSALRQSDAMVLRDLAGALRAFGDLVLAQSRPQLPAEAELAGLDDALEELREARARLTELVLSEPDPERAEVNFALMAAVRRVLSELDPDQRLRRQAPDHPPSRLHVPHVPHVPRVPRLPLPGRGPRPPDGEARGRRRR